MSQTVYLVTSDDRDRPDTFFQGYCFHGSHFVYGDAGARAFAAATGERIGQGEDGCYVSVEAEGEEVVVRNDFAGYKKVFYVSGDGFWAVSNSLFRLVEHLRRHERPVVPNYAQLATLAGRSSGHAQLSSFATPVHGIALAPMGTALRIGARGARLEPGPDARRRPGCYAEALGTFLDVWVSRFATLLSDERMRLTADVTRGVDSRTVMTLVETAREGVGRTSGGARRGQYRCGSIKGDPVDLRIAKRLADRFRFSLNEGGPFPEGPAIERFEGWRDLCLGVYHPIYFPRVGPDPFHVHLTGGGGSNHRPFYARQHGQDDLAGFLAIQTQQLEPKFLRPEFRRDVLDALRRIEGLGDEGDPLILHYRHFRSRLHAGREPQTSVTFAPLGSRSLDDCTALAGPERVERAQVFYDVMASIRPEALDIAFDVDEKNPSALVRSTLTHARAPAAPTPGEIFAGGTHDEAGGGEGGRPKPMHPLKRLRREFDAARRRPFVEAFCGSETLEEADAAMTEAETSRRFFHASNGRPVALALTCAMVRP